MKIENAIILAAGRGSRMLDITNDIPKPLLISTINDKTFIENIIESLQLANIKEIIIVVGYKSDKFEFLKKNYNVKLIKNNN